LTIRTFLLIGNQISFQSSMVNINPAKRTIDAFMATPSEVLLVGGITAPPKVAQFTYPVPEYPILTVVALLSLAVHTFLNKVYPEIPVPPIETAQHSPTLVPQSALFTQTPV